MNASREMLHAYLEDALTDAETAQLENALRSKPELREQLRLVIQERDRGEHSIGGIWRRERLSCPSREQLGSYLLQVLDTDHHSYVEFHLKTVVCSMCVANLADLEEQHAEAAPHARERRKRYFHSSAGLLKK